MQAKRTEILNSRDSGAVSSCEELKSDWKVCSSQKQRQAKTSDAWRLTKTETQFVRANTAELRKKSTLSWHQAALFNTTHNTTVLTTDGFTILTALILKCYTSTFRSSKFFSMNSTFKERAKKLRAKLISWPDSCTTDLWSFHNGNRTSSGEPDVLSKLECILATTPNVQWMQLHRYHSVAPKCAGSVP